jgi:DNA polymerase-1
MSKLVLIDGNAILHRAYHALPPLTTKKKEPINAVYGFISMFLKIVQDLRPTHLVVCFDRKEPTFRHEEFKEYQAHRPKMDKELSSQFDKARDVIKAFGIPIYDKAGYEADDVIGTLAKQAVGDIKILRYKDTEKKSKKAPNISVSQYPNIDEVIIVTGDRDILQLVTEKVKVYLPIRGLSEAQLMEEKDVVEKMGVKPNQIDEYKALVGDPSDNYPGVPGVGPKTAVSLLSKYKNLDEIYKNLEKIPEATAKKLKEGEKSARVSQKLAEIVTDVPIKFSLKKSAKWKLNSKRVLDLFAEYGFKTLTKRVKKVGEEIDEEKQMKLL